MRPALPLLLTTAISASVELTHPAHAQRAGHDFHGRDVRAARSTDLAWRPCKQYVDQQVAGGPQQASNQQVLIGAVGPALGAEVGAALGGGCGAEVGAGSGDVAGTEVGAGPARQAQISMQRRYDTAYTQCMYSRGNQIASFTPAYTLPPPPPR